MSPSGYSQPDSTPFSFCEMPVVECRRPHTM
jgi:hypothetical protein